MTVHTAYRWRKQMIWGIAMIAAGAVLLLDQIELIQLEFNLAQPGAYWPWLLVISGITKIIPPTTPRIFPTACGRFSSPAGGMFFNHIWGVGFGETWPALLVAWGVGMLLRPLLDNIFASTKEQA
jgi:hypothetical protein